MASTSPAAQSTLTVASMSPHIVGPASLPMMSPPSLEPETPMPSNLSANQKKRIKTFLKVRCVS
jgi:hypothetical protein